MNFVAILASGVGSRMKTLNYPKQFYEINNKPILIYTIEKFLASSLVDYIYVATNPNYIEYTTKLLTKFELNDKVTLLSGGKTRMDTIDNVITAICENREIRDNDIILIHDAVRPFITKKIIKDSIEGAKKYGATVAVIPAVDTIVASSNGKKVDSIPNRSDLFYGQSPDTFRLKEFIQMKDNLTEEQRKIVTGTSQICTFNNRDIYFIDGDPINFKITTDFDLLIAQKIIEEKYKDGEEV